METLSEGHDESKSWRAKHTRSLENSKVVSLLSLGYLLENHGDGSAPVDCGNVMDERECQAKTFRLSLLGTLGTLEGFQSLADIQNSVLLAQT